MTPTAPKARSKKSARELLKLLTDNEATRAREVVEAANEWQQALGDKRTDAEMALGAAVLKHRDAAQLLAVATGKGA